MEAAESAYRELMLLDKKYKDAIVQDLPRWSHVYDNQPLDERAFFLKLFESRQEFRTLLRYRSYTCGCHEYRDLLGRMSVGLPWFFVDTLFIECAQIGPGLYIQHGFASIVYAQSIGSNLWLNQNVTVGSSYTGIPTIGDNVSLRAHSMVVGNVTIGDNVQVGAGAVVTKSIPPGAKVRSARIRVTYADGTSAGNL